MSPPTATGQSTDPRNGGTSPDRDELELGLLAAALDRDLPVLAICRGMQVLNVLLGGDLVQHLPDVVGSDAHQPRPGAFGPVRVWRRARLARWPGSWASGPRCCAATTRPSGRLGAGLVVTATSADGVIEAVELAGRPFRGRACSGTPRRAGDAAVRGLVADGRWSASIRYAGSRHERA